MTKVVVLCDCGCGQTIEKMPCKFRQHQHHFVDIHHYYQWMAGHQKKPDHSPLNRLKRLGEEYKKINGGEW